MRPSLSVDASTEQQTSRLNKLISLAPSDCPAYAWHTHNALMLSGKATLECPAESSHNLRSPRAEQHNTLVPAPSCHFTPARPSLVAHHYVSQGPQASAAAPNAFHKEAVNRRLHH